MPEQEISIREREEQLFFEPDEPRTASPVKPFPVYLRETPADPISPGVKAILWIVGVAVFLLLCVALWRTTHRPSRLSRTRAATKRASTHLVPQIPADGLGRAGVIAWFPQGSCVAPPAVSGDAADRASES